MDNLAGKGQGFLLHSVGNQVLETRVVDPDVLELFGTEFNQPQTDVQVMQ